MNYLNVLAIIIIKNWPCIYKYADIDNHEVTILTLPDYQTKACWLRWMTLIIFDRNMGAWLENAKLYCRQRISIAESTAVYSLHWSNSQKISTAKIATDSGYKQV